MSRSGCAVSDCRSPHWARSYCRLHYRRWLKHGTAEPREISEAERFWSHVNVGEPDDCWEWKAATVKGYGRGRSAARGYYYAHRLSYELAHGAIGDEVVVRHRCDNPPCVNPAHLELGAQDDNIADMIVRGRAWWQGRTHCKRGHEYSPENTYRRPGDGSRVCRTCVKLGRRRRTAA